MIPFQKIPIIPFFHSLTNVPEEQIYSISIVLLGIPLSLINYLIHSPKSRLYYSLISGLILQFLIYEKNMIHVLIASLYTYWFVSKFGRKKTAFYVLFPTLLYLSGIHIYRLITAYGKWEVRDPTNIYMITMCKFSSFAFSYEDGILPDSAIKSERLRKLKIEKLPTLTEFLSFIYFYPTATLGPSVEFIDYFNFIHLKGCYTRMSIIRNIKFGILRLLIAIGFLGVYGLYQSKFPPDYIGTEEFASLNIINKLLFTNIETLLTKSKYYGGWTLAYSILIMSGMSYGEKEIVNQKTGKLEIQKNYDKGYIGNAIKVETSSDPSDVIEQWNHSCHLWLKYCVYIRLKMMKKPSIISSFVTFLCSAFWHGFYPCYYIFFGSFFLLQQTSNILNGILFYDWLKSHIILRIVFTLFLQNTVNGISVIFFALTYPIIKNYLISIYCMPILSVLVYYLFALILKKIKPKVKED